MNRVSHKARLLGILVVLFAGVLGFTQQAAAQCVPASDPDLNNDGIVSLADIYIVTSKFGIAGGDETADTNCDGNVDTTDVLFVRSAIGQTFPVGPSLTVDAPDSFSVDEGDTKNISYTVSLQTGNLQTVVLTQEVSPQDGGLSFTNDAPPVWESSNDVDWVVNGTISGLLAGNYVITTTATIQGTFVSTVSETVVEVVSSDPIAQIFVGAPSADPDGIAVGTPTVVDFDVHINTGVGVPDVVILQEVDDQGALIQEIGALFDDGQGGDLVAQDLTYGLSVNLPPMAEGELKVRAVAWFGADSVVSEVGVVPVTPLPTTLTPSDPLTLIESEDPDQRIFSDQIIVAFNDGVSSAAIEATVALVGGEIIGSIPSLNIFQIGFAVPKTLDELNAIVDDYEAQPDVEYAELAAETTTNAVYPDDPRKGSQNNMQVSRVDEVWLLNAGGGTIAIVDTGVDYNHDDLDVVKGKDYVSWNPFDNDPMDEDGHGTGVAGIAAAIINNKKDVSGVSNSTILAVRGIGGSNADLAKAIKYAAGRASVVNISGGSFSGYKTYEKVTKKLGSQIIVASAGNESKEKKQSPCANTNVFCVGNSTDSDGRAPSSSFGDWVDIAAPGIGITTTKLGGGTTFWPDGGTSSASPLVAGAARLVWNQHPGWSAAKVKQRLLDTAVAAPGLKGKKIGDRIDVFEAFFNGDFEIDVEEWAVTGTCSEKTQLGPIKPKKGDKMMFCSTGPAGDQVAATLSKSLSFEANSDFVIKFDYNFVSEEYPEFVGSIFNDSLTIKLVAPNGAETILAQESVNASDFSSVSGIDFPGGDNTVGQTGWEPISKTIPVTKGGGSYKIVIEDAGDDIYDTAVLLDNIRLK